MEYDRKKEVINTCLDLFISKGINETSTRNLSSALELQNSGLYYYFASKDEAVVECVNEAITRIEIQLIQPLLQNIRDMYILIEDIFLGLKQWHSRCVLLYKHVHPLHTSFCNAINQKNV